jgi:hypothetical protein
VGLLFPSRIIFQRRKGKKKKFQFAEMLPQQMIRSLVKRNKIRSDSSPGGLHSCCSCCFDSGHAGPGKKFVLCVCVCVCVCVLQAFSSYFLKSVFRSYLFKSVFEEEQEESDLAISKTDLELLIIFMKQNSCNEGFFVCFLFIISL